MATQTTSTKIKETITKITELEAVKRHFDSTLEELDAILDKKDEIENLMIKELEDINNLEKLGVRSIFHKVLGNKEEQLEKERQEYLQVTLQHKEIVNALEVVEFEKNVLEKKVLGLDELEKELKNLKQKREKEILQITGPLRNELLLIHKKKDDLSRYEIELKEAFAAGKQTIQSLNVVHGHLKKAKDWGNWDMVSNKGGRYHKRMKHGAIDRAMHEISRSKLYLRTFNKELADIGYSNRRLGLQVESIAQFPGMIFDNLISDWIVQNKIKGVLSTVGNLHDDVNLLMKSMERDMKNASQEYAELAEQRSHLLENK